MPYSTTHPVPQLQLDNLEPFIRRVVEETLAQQAANRPASTSTPESGEPDGRDGVSLVNARQAAKALAISERKLWEMTKNGEIPHVPVGRAIRYDPRDLRAWVEAQKKSGTKEEAHG
jgi:excisionase family DNA binding protein